MSKTIWKAVLELRDTQQIEVPAGAEFLTAREQGQDICIWYRCDPAAPKVSITVAIIGTGHAAPEDGRYVGTGMFGGGVLVFHVFVKS